MDNKHQTISHPSRLTARLFDFIDIHPSHIQQSFYSQHSRKLYISRKLYSQVYCVGASNDIKSITIQQIMVLQPCQQIYQIDGMIVLVLPFQIKVNNFGKWLIYPFTTQLLPNNTKYDTISNKLYTFHINQCRQWSISQDNGIDIRYLNKYQIPYHINSQGILQGYGKKIKPNNYKDNKFTIIQMSECKGYLFIGSDKGYLHIYQTKYLTHVKTFHRHQAAILSIKVKDNICYWTGSDSKISSIVYILNQQDNNGDGKGSGNWVLSKQVRGQSHDIMSIETIDFVNNKQNKQDDNNCKYLISGGITTDICFYKLTHNRILTDQWVHKISYTCQKLTEYVNNYIIVNKYTTFQIWKISQDINNNNKTGVQLLVKYQMPFYKNIRQILSKSDNKKSITIFVRTQQQATLWTFDQVQGLNKSMTVKNNYNIAIWHKKDCLITIRDGNKLQVLNYKTGNIQEIAQTNVEYPTDLKLSINKEDKILIGSKYSKQIQLIKVNTQKNGKSLSVLNLQQQYNILDFCYYNPQNIMIKYSLSQIIHQIDKKGGIVNDIVKLPVKKVRDFGWLPFCINQKRKIFWYAVSQGKLVIVSRMKTFTKDKKIRVKQMPRIGNVISRNTTLSKQKEQQKQEPQIDQWNFGIIPLNFSKMISEEINPIMTKKIL